MAVRSPDLRALRALLRTGSRSFHLAGLLLPPAPRAAATSLYAFCRLADDAIDGPQRDPCSLAQLRSRLDRVYAGTPLPQPVERLLARTVRSCAIPRTVLEALLQGFEWDAGGRRYETLSELIAYAARVAGSVGVMMTLVLGVREPAVLARASELGIAMQLTNIARDVGEDARQGRLYLPRAWLREAGIEPEQWLAQPRFSAELAAVIERLLRVADELYARSAAGIGRLPARTRPAIHAARLLYAQIGHDLRRHGHDSLARRAHVGGARKGALLLLALVSALAPRSALALPAPPEAQFLLDAVRTLAPPAARPSAPRGWDDATRPPRQSRAEWVLELFARLEQAERGAAR